MDYRESKFSTKINKTMESHRGTWSGCNMGWPGLKTMHYIQPDPGGPLWLSIQDQSFTIHVFMVLSGTIIDNAQIH